VFKGYTTATGAVLTGTWRESTYTKFPILKEFAANTTEVYSEDDQLESTTTPGVLVVDDPTYTNERGHAFTNAEAYNTGMQIFVAYVNLYNNNISVVLDIPQDAYHMPDTIEGLDIPKPAWRLDDMVQPVDFVVSLAKAIQLYTPMCTNRTA
jgi:hypothetical protein